MSTFRLARRAPLTGGLEVPMVAADQDGVFTRSQARSQGWSDGRQRRLMDSGLWVPVTSHVLRHRDVVVGPWQRARAVWLTGGMVVSHDTAGQLWGLLASDGLHGTSVSSRRTTAVVTRRADLPSADSVDVDGMRVTTPPRTVTDLLCTLEPLASVAMACDALSQGILTTADVRSAADSAMGRHGAARARFVARTCAGRPHSVLEWHFHRRVGALGAGWRFNTSVYDAEGKIGDVDAVHEGTRIVVELDGQQFHGPDRFQADRTRDQRLAAVGYVVLRFTWDDLTRRPDDVIERIRRTMSHRARLVA
jgi:very-short-patch-repair endonuclease